MEEEFARYVVNTVVTESTYHGIYREYIHIIKNFKIFIVRDFHLFLH